MGKKNKNTSKILKINTVWSHFTVTDNAGKLAKCNICDKILCFKSTSANLKKHMGKKHPTIDFNLTSTPLEEEMATSIVRREIPVPTLIQPTIVHVRSSVTSESNFITDSVWSHFSVTDKYKKLARCDICEQIFCYKSTSANLKKHMDNKHPAINLNLTKCPLQAAMAEITPATQETEYTTPMRVKSTTPMRVKSTKPKMKTNSVWSHFSVTDNDKKLAQCDICDQVFCYKSTSGNLKKHIDKRHPTINLNLTPIEAAISEISATQEIVSTSPHVQLSKSISPQGLPDNKIILKQQLQQLSALPKNTPMAQKKNIERYVLNLFITDYQPISIIEDGGFIQLIKLLSPNYKLPSRKAISNILLPAEYKLCLKAVQLAMSSVSSVCLTTDTWTSNNNESFLAVTAHFIDDNFDLKGALLECVTMPQSYTNENMKEEILEITEKYNLSDKVLAVVTDNASNIQEVVTEELMWHHFGCFGHTLNQIVQEALLVAKEIIDKIKVIVTYFKKSTIASEKLMSTQETLYGTPKKLIKGIETRWNSTFYMISRFVELEGAIKTSLGLLNNSELPTLLEEEWAICKELIQILEPFEQVTMRLCSDKYVTGSEVIILAQGMSSLYEEMKIFNYTPMTTNVIQLLYNGLNARMHQVEYFKPIALATLLDPRYKLLGFSDLTAADDIINYCTELIASKIKDDMNLTILEEVEEKESVQVNTPTFSVWKKFDQKISTSKPPESKNKTSIAIAELRRFIDEDPLERNQDPLLWWRKKQFSYPNLSQVVKEKFVMVATSVPCKRIFSKTGDTLNIRRNFLKAKKAEQLVFLNGNSCFLN